MDPLELAAWHRVAAENKADSITALAPAGVATIVDIGCGSGAVLEALDRRGFGKLYWGCEPTRSLYDAIPTGAISRLAGTSPSAFDGAFLDQPNFDLGIISHVVEHLRTPAVLIAQALDRCRWLVVEVPIEDNVLGRVRVAIKGLMGRDRFDNPSGHVQFFSRITARALVQHAGGTVVSERAYYPVSASAALASHRFQRAVVNVGRASNFLGRRYYEHFAMLASAADYSRLQGNYIAPR